MSKPAAIDTDMTEEKLRKLLRQAELALEESKKRYQQLNKDTSVRLGELAHEIKNPLNAIIGFSEIMMSERFGSLGHDHYKEYNELIHSSAQHLLSICEQELDYARRRAQGEDAQPGTVRHEEIAIDTMFVEVMSDLTFLADEHGVSIKTEISDDFPILKTDPTRLKQVLYNLVSNAVKFTPDGGEVIVRAKLDEIDGAMILVIQDNGFGMATEDVLRVMEPFERIEDYESESDIEGTGLGLSIAQRLAEEMGAILELRSQPDVGTLVTLKFPEDSDD